MTPVRFRLKEILGDRSRYWLAEASGVSYPTVSSIYHNVAKGVTLEVLGKLAAALGCYPGDLLSPMRGADRLASLRKPGK
jgi:DNA-binding Xre family transcriptional regulator